LGNSIAKGVDIFEGEGFSSMARGAGARKNNF
jgi:hypothetical protein